MPEHQVNMTKLRQPMPADAPACDGSAPAAEVITYTNAGSAVMLVLVTCGNWLASIAKGTSNHS